MFSVRMREDGDSMMLSWGCFEEREREGVSYLWIFGIVS